jgi:hypothetical protein
LASPSKNACLAAEALQGSLTFHLARGNTVVVGRAGLRQRLDSALADL